MPSDAPQITVGLDVGYEAVRLVALEQTPDGPVLHRVGIQSLPRPRTPRTLFADAADVSAAIRAVFASYGDPAWPVVGGLRSRFATIVRSQVDKSADAQAQIAWLMWEAAQVVIDPIEEYVVDIALTGRETKTTHEALVVAARTESVNALSQLFQEAGLTPAALTVATIALFNAFEASYGLGEGRPVALVHIEPGAWDVLFIRGGLSKVMTMSFDPDTGGGASRRAGDDAAIKAFGTQFQALLNTLSVEEAPDWIVVSGELDGLPEVCTRWADILNRPVTPASPFQQMSVIPTLSEMMQSDCLAPFMVATGLALRPLS